MARSYSQEFLLDLHMRQSEDLGTRLARACVEANLPMAHVARALGVTKLSVFFWFRGGNIRETNAKRVEALLRIIREDMKNGTLPAKTIADAKAFVDSIIAPVEVPQNQGS